jgi:S1-C subfamily serine protease
VETDRPSSSDESKTESRTLPGVVIVTEGQAQVLTTDAFVQSADWIGLDFGAQPVAARVVSSEPTADIALLEPEDQPASFNAAPVGDSDALKSKDDVYALTLSPTGQRDVVAGHLVDRRRPDLFLQELIDGDVLELQLPIGKDAVGPLFDGAGHLIGIVSPALARLAASTNTCAIPINLALQLTVRQMSFWTGITAREIAGEEAKKMNLPQERGFLVEHVAPESPAARAGLRGATRTVTVNGKPAFEGGDVLLSLNDISLAAPDGRARTRQKLRSLPVGARLKIKVFRDGKVVTLSTAFER